MNLSSPRSRAWIDFGLVVVVALVCGWAAADVELIEWLFAHTRRWERFQVDELAVVLVSLALGMTWFAARRYLDARREMHRRNEAQSRLAESLAEQRRLAQRYVLLQEAERKALARELHDELGQYLNAIKLEAVTLRDTPRVDAARENGATAIIANADHVYRTVGALIRRLRPVGLDELGLAAALEHLVDGARGALLARCRLTITGSLEYLGEACDLTIYRLVQEGLTNCARHASAGGVEIELMRDRGADGDSITLAMTDDGADADWSKHRDGLGLVGMRERVEALGGVLHITHRTRPRVSLRRALPCAGDIEMTTGAIKVRLVDDHAVVRAGYRHLLARDARLEVVGEAADAQSAYLAFCALAPDVVVMDIALPGASGIDAMRRMLAREPRARVLMFSMYEDVIFPPRALQAGALGYLTKSSGPDMLVEAVLAVARGETHLSNDVAQTMALRAKAAALENAATLSAREFEVLQMLARGETLAQIAARLLLSEKTVANYQSSIKQKLGASNNIQLLQSAVRLGLLPVGGMTAGGDTKS